uniref:Alpha-galactosidase NEW3 domain-containing protein n=1 Tax=Neobacillus citreus TaxID=2833578 RepID=A0A942T025_9BACI
MTTITIIRPRTRPGKLTPMAAMTVVLAFLFGVLVPTPALADDLDDTAAGYYEEFQRLIDGDLENEIEPLGTPEFVYRGDFREWSQIQAAGGFEPHGANLNIADHVLDLRVPKDTGFIATSSDPEFPEWFMGTIDKPEDAETFTVYKIRPSGQYRSVVKSFYDSIYPDGTLENYDRAVLEQLETAKPRWFEHVQGEYEWASEGKIPASAVVEYEVNHWNDDEDAWDLADPWKTNPEFAEPTTSPTLDSSRFDTVSCPAPTALRTSCADVPGTEDDLADLHGDRFTGDPEDFDFSLRPEELASEESALLAPAPDTVDVVSDFAGAVEDPASFAAFTDEIGGSFAADVDALAEVSSHLDVLTSLGEAMDLGLDSASELIPYLGIAATGYAIKEDADLGAWGDYAADSIAEGIQAMMVVAPEFDWILAPALWADLIAKAIGDWIYGLAHPAPNYTTEYRDNLAKAHDQVDAAPTVLTDAWTDERDTVLDDFYKEHMGERLGTTLAAKISSDAAVIKEMDRAVTREIDRHQRLALTHATTDVERMQVRRSALTAEYQLHDTTRSAIAERVQQYRDRYPEVIDATAAETWALDLSALAEDGFLDDEKVHDYTVKVSEIAWEASYQKTWDEFESWELETAGPRRDAEAQALRDIVVNSERSGIKTEALAHKPWLVKQLGAQVDKAIEKSIAVPADESATTLGVHDLEVVTNDADAWAKGSTGVVRWDRQSATGASGIDATPGTQLTWRLQLPQGLEPIALPADDVTQYWSQTWEQDGRIVTHTVQRRSGAAENAFAERQVFEIPVRATADIAARELVEVRFEAPFGHRSLAGVERARLAGVVGVPEPLRAVSFPTVDLHPTDTTPVRLGIRAADRAVTTLRGELTLTAPEGTKFVAQTSVDAFYRTSSDGAWHFDGGLPTSATVSADGSSMTLRPASKSFYALQPGYQSSWLPELTVTDDTVAGVRDLVTHAALTTNIGTATLSIDTPVSSERRSTLSPLLLDPVTLTDWDAWQRVRFAGVETNQELSANGAVVLQRPTGLVFSRNAKVLLEGRSSPSAPWTTLQEATDVTWQTNAVRIGFHGSWDKGMQLAWSVEVRSEDFGGPTEIIAATSVTAKPGDTATSGSTSITTATPPTVGVAVPGEFAATYGTTSSFEVPFHNTSDVRATGIRAEIESVGESKMWFIAKWRRDGQSDWTMLNAKLDKGVLHIDDQSVPTIAPGGKATLLFTMLPLGPLDSAQPGGVIRFTGGGIVAPGAEHRFDLRLSKTPPVDPPEPEVPAVTVRQSIVPELRSGATGDVVYEVRNDGNAATSKGTILDLTPPANAEFATRQIQYAVGDGGWQTVDAYLSWPAPELRFDLKEFQVPAKTVARIKVAVTSTAPTAAAGEYRGGFSSPHNDAVPAQTHPMVFRAVASDPSRVLVQCRAGDSLMAEAQVKWATAKGRYTATVERFRIDADGARGSLGVMVRQGGGFEGPWATKSGLPLDGQWRDLGLTATAYDQDLGRIDGLLDVEVESEGGYPVGACQRWFVMPS